MFLICLGCRVAAPGDNRRALDIAMAGVFMKLACSLLSLFCD